MDSNKFDPAKQKQNSKNQQKRSSKRRNTSSSSPDKSKRGYGYTLRNVCEQLLENKLRNCGKTAPINVLIHSICAAYRSFLSSSICVTRSLLNLMKLITDYYFSSLWAYEANVAHFTARQYQTSKFVELENNPDENAVRTHVDPVKYRTITTISSL